MNINQYRQFLSMGTVLNHTMVKKYGRPATDKEIKLFIKLALEQECPTEADFEDYMDKKTTEVFEKVSTK